MNVHLPRIYPITDTRISGLSHLDQVVRLVNGGARFIQLREKYASPRDFYDAAKDVIAFAAERSVTIIINDRVDIALVSNAAGVHLGQDDMPPEHARELLGPRAIIGYSTHTFDQACAAVDLPVDYIAYGPIFQTATKENPDAVVGTEELKGIRNSIGRFPLVAIGGISRDNLNSVIDAGADSAAIIGAILSDPSNIAAQYGYLNSIARRLK
ncbi:MAG: thiamine phosphate synthase [Pyrinomonadaceae bacterium]